MSANLPSPHTFSRGKLLVSLRTLASSRLDGSVVDAISDTVYLLGVKGIG